MQADCYANGSLSRPVPTGYPSNTTETFDFNLTKVPSGYLDVTLRSTAAGNPVIAGGQVQVSGGQANIAPRVRDTDAAGKVRFCLDPSGSVNYVVSAAKAGFGAGSVLATVNVNQTTPLTMYLVPSAGTGTIRLTTATSGKLVRLQAVSGTYDAQQTTNTALYADFTGLASGKLRRVRRDRLLGRHPDVEHRQVGDRDGQPGHELQRPVTGRLRQRRRRRTQAGFTLVELLIGIILSSVFAIAIYGMFFSTLDSARNQQTQWLAQSTGRTAVDRLSSEIRQSVSPDDGLTPPMISVSPTSIEMYVDSTRSTTALRPIPDKVRYRIVSDQLIRDRARPTTDRRAVQLRPVRGARGPGGRRPERDDPARRADHRGRAGARDDAQRRRHAAAGRRAGRPSGCSSARRPAPRQPRWS